MASDFPCHVTEGIEDGDVQEFAVSTTAGETAAATGELMYYDTATQTIKRCGADPSLIAGIATGPSATARLLTPNNKIPLQVLNPRVGVRMCSATTPAETHVGVAYGVVRLASGNWAVDTSDTSATRLIVYRVDIGTGAFFVRFTAANLQLDAIAS